MSDGEMAIWAAAYAAFLGRVSLAGGDQFSLQMIRSAVEYAGNTVKRLREERDNIRFSGNRDAMLEEMVPRR